MSLPKVALKYPLVKVELPISKKIVTIRPFLTKEEKLMLFIKEASDAKEVIAIVNRVVDSCCSEKIDSAKLPIPDVEYLFLQIRCISKGETQDLNYICKKMISVPVKPEEPDGEKVTMECGTRMKHTVNLEKLKPLISPDHTNKIPIPGTPFIFTMKYPTYSMVPSGDVEKKLTSASMFDLLIDLIESVVDTEEGTSYTDFTKEEMTEFLDNIYSNVVDEIYDKFIDKIPTLSYDFDFTCPRCGTVHPMHLKGLSDFFS